MYGAHYITPRMVYRYDSLLTEWIAGASSGITVSLPTCYAYLERELDLACVTQPWPRARTERQWENAEHRKGEPE